VIQCYPQNNTSAWAVTALSHTVKNIIGKLQEKQVENAPKESMKLSWETLKFTCLGHMDGGKSKAQM